MKNLLIFTLIVGLFTECKKSEEVPDTCYLGTWGNNQVQCTDLPAKNVLHSVKLSLREDGTGEIRTLLGCGYGDYNGILTFKYVIEQDNIVLSNHNLIVNTYKVQSTDYPYGTYFYNLTKLKFTCPATNQLQILGEGIGNNPNGNGYTGTKNIFTKL